jgi:hypothetical protein
MGEWRHSSTFLHLGTRWRWVVSFTPLPLYPWGKSPWYPLDRGLSDWVINEYVAVGKMRICKSKSKNLEKTYLSATVSITSATWPDQGSDLGSSGEKLVTDGQSDGLTVAVSLSTEHNTVSHTTISRKSGCRSLLFKTVRAYQWKSATMYSIR